jgi:short-subunit dehydrogenase
VFGLNESLRRELKKMKSNVGTTIICPGYINTGLFEGFKQSKLANLFSPPQTEENIAKIIVKVTWFFFVLPCTLLRIPVFSLLKKDGKK